MSASYQIAVVAAGGLAVSLWLSWLGRRARHCHGLGVGSTLSLDGVTLRSQRLRLAGRPDRLVKTGGCIIPEEWKSSRRLRPWHRAQVGVYLALIEEQFGTRPPYGVVVTGDGRRHVIENTAGLRAWVLSLAAEIRAARANASEPIAVEPVIGQCEPCGMRPHCRQARS
jgi:CRISPR-associated exonuclease Cas4